MVDILLSFFFFTASIVGFATSAMILFSKANYSKSFFLGMFFFSLAVVSVYNFYLSAKIFKDFPDLFMVTKSFLFLAAPCAFLYVRDVLSPDSPHKRHDWFHFLPFQIYFSLTLVVWTGNYTDIRFIDQLSVLIKSPFSLLSLTVWLIYAFCQTMMLLNYDLKKFSSSCRKSNYILLWIRIYNLAVLILFCALFVHFVLTNNSSADYSCYILISSVLIFTVSFLYFKPALFLDLSENGSRITAAISNDFVQEPDHKNTLTVKEISTVKKQVYLSQLEDIFKTKKLFLKKDLIIRDLADETGISVHELSMLINSEFNVHFQDFINIKRIEYFKERIDAGDWKDLSLEGMSWGCGFKSRSTCFRAFVKHTGKAPSEYLKAVILGLDCPDNTAITSLLPNT